ncbi:hypothetical protein [Agromyces sp. SYSU T00194]|uniref:hypothetical protein n=1 Tax=Agromyces chitinivorans TaxID=3158560 RepID=UPI00339B107C
MCTIHANSAADALLKLCTLPLLAGRNIDAAFVVPTVMTSVDLVVHTSLTAEGARQVDEISVPRRTGSETDAAGMRLGTHPVFSRTDGVLRAVSTSVPSTRKFATAGIDVETLLRDAA